MTARSLIMKLPGMLRQYRDVRAARRDGRAPATLPLLQIETTTECNARCGMCGYPSDYPAAAAPMDTAELFRLVDQAAELGTLIVSLGGGEPFLRDDAEALIRHIDAHGISTLAHSNGSLLGRERCARLAENDHLILALSLDSPRRAEHDGIRGVDCFDRVIAAARHFAKEAPQVRVILTCTITGRNYRDLLGIMRLADDIGARTVRFTPLHENLQHRFRAPADFALFALPDEALPILTEQLAEVGGYARRRGMITNSAAYLDAIPDYFRGRVPHDCYAGFFFCSIDPQGRLFPCYDHQSEVNVRGPGGLAAAFNSPEMDALRRRVLGCDRRCWNVGTAEPSLRMAHGPLGRPGLQLLRETWLMLR